MSPVMLDTRLHFGDKTQASSQSAGLPLLLVSKQGALKDHIDAAPNNGYYVLQVFDRGEYVLKVSGPSGWVFMPSEIALNVDGANDPCSQGKDINFHFQGFVVNGTVS
ncbi:unnamed protein product [Bemisia tabaci]|uniref:NOMO-like N-terminal beta-sandwich domain-containing protein n=1 Tax=Bemisia tabaci TaxID=7038 RepID=A0A9P0A645_BEMTA|nr:unnamed protein product [Bemisia tabaci]